MVSSRAASTFCPMRSPRPASSGDSRILCWIALRLTLWGPRPREWKPRRMSMFEQTPRTRNLHERLTAFMAEHIYPDEQRYFGLAEKDGPWKVSPVVEELKPKARAQGLWNLFLPDENLGSGLTNSEYAPLCEIMGRSLLAPEVFNCSAPD